MITRDQLDNTTIGQEYLYSGEALPVDLVLEYLFRLINCRQEHVDNPVWLAKYNLEIEATKEILKIITK